MQFKTYPLSSVLDALKSTFGTVALGFVSVLGGIGCGAMVAGKGSIKDAPALIRLLDHLLAGQGLVIPPFLLLCIMLLVRVENSRFRLGLLGLLFLVPFIKLWLF